MPKGQSNILVTSIFLFTLLTSVVTVAQDSLPFSHASSYLNSIDKKSQTLVHKLERENERLLKRWHRQQEKIFRKIRRKDSVLARQLFESATTEKVELIEKWSGSTELKEYIPFLDSVQTSLAFLEQQKLMQSISPEKIQQVKSSLKEFNSTLQQASDIKTMIRQQRDALKAHLNNLGFVKDLKRLNKEVYYYSQQVNEYKEIFKDPRKRERKALDLLAQSKLFQDFMKRNSRLASMFRMPATDPNDPAWAASLAGLQTRSQVNGLIQGQLNAAGPGAAGQLSQQLQAAQSQIQQLKNRVERFGGHTSGDDLPEGFRPNQQKTKSFLQRLEFGVNLQSQRATQFFPVTSDLGISLAYKLNDRSTIGTGASYKVGWGSGWKDIDITHQGISLRSFVDWKIKGNFYVCGGYELNYRNNYSNIGQLQKIAAWKESGLIGLSKKFSYKSKVFKKTSLSVFWDFCSYHHIPKAQPILFRVGYVLK